jgi:hypothetical protein
MKVQLLHKRNITGFGLVNPNFGKIFIGHSDPIHKVPHMYPQLQPIFSEYDIIVGDMNACWHRLILPNKYNSVSLVDANQHYVYNPISYLTSVQPSDPRDARLDMIICKYEQPMPIDVGIKFDNFHKHKKPRFLMQELVFPSDHLPIKAYIVHPDNPKEHLMIGFWNVADPIYWAQYYPKALDGFDLKGEDSNIDLKKEHSRLESILKWVNYLADDCDVLGLAEVPIKLIPDLQLIAKKYEFVMEYQAEHSDIWRPNDPISQIVVMFKP